MFRQTHYIKVEETISFDRAKYDAAKKAFEKAVEEAKNEGITSPGLFNQYLSSGFHSASNNKVRIKQAELDACRYYYSYGTSNTNSHRYGKSPIDIINEGKKYYFTPEDELINLINRQSGLTDENSTINIRTDMMEEQVELRLYYQYYDHDAEAIPKTDRKFADEMISFLKSAEKNLKLTYDYQALYPSDSSFSKFPVLIFRYADLENLILKIKLLNERPKNLDLLKGPVKPHMVARVRLSQNL